MLLVPSSSFLATAVAAAMILSNDSVVAEAAEGGEGWYSIDDPNPDPTWINHTYHQKVLYRPLDEIHKLWQDGFFDYVYDSRGLNDSVWETPNGPIPLEGWESKHIPDAYPLHAGPNVGNDTYITLDNVTFLTEGVTAPACRESRIFVYCWVGLLGNQAAELLESLGFNNVYAAGPEGSAGLWKWEASGYDLVYNASFDPGDVPSCAIEDGEEEVAEEEETGEEVIGGVGPEDEVKSPEESDDMAPTTSGSGAVSSLLVVAILSAGLTSTSLRLFH